MTLIGRGVVVLLLGILPATALAAEATSKPPGLFKTLRGHTGSMGSIAVSGNRIVSGSRDKTTRIWELP